MKLGTVIIDGRSCLGGTAMAGNTGCVMLIHKHNDAYRLRVELHDGGTGSGASLSKTAMSISEAITMITEFIERKTGVRLAIVASTEV